MKINHNLSAVVANDNLMINEDRLTTALERLSSGLKINSAKDNPTGMAMSIKMQSQIDGLNKASDNSEDGISLLQTADGALNEVTLMLQRMRELAVQAANGTNSITDRESIQAEVDALVEEVDRISQDTDFNGTTIFDGSMDTRVYTDNTEVSCFEISQQVKKGTYTVTINEEATAASFSGSGVGSAYFLNDSDDYTAVAGVSGTLTINDLSVEIDATDTQAEIYLKIRDCAEKAGAVASVNDDGSLLLTADEEGSDVTLTVACSTDELNEYLGLGLTDDDGDGTLSETRAGTDVQATLGDEFQATATAIGVGNKLNITDMNGFSMVLKVGDVEDDTEVSVNVTGIGTMTLQIGANKDQTLEVKIPDLGSESLGIDNLNYLNPTSISRAINKLDDAITKLSNARSAIGAYENRLEHTSASLGETEEDLTSALSRVTDVDMAEEMSEYTNLQVLTQAGTSVLAQANQIPEQVLQMLQ